MNVAGFIAMLTIESVAAGALTQTVKQFYINAGKKYNANVIALVNAIVLGGLLTAGIYLIKDIPFNTDTIIELMALCVLNWIGSMVGYDKILQTFAEQSKNLEAITTVAAIETNPENETKAEVKTDETKASDATKAEGQDAPADVVADKK